MNVYPTLAKKWNYSVSTQVPTALNKNVNRSKNN